jgi:putative ATP-dependent endonuclease of OLD family
MLGQGVIVGEGITEQFALAAAAQNMEKTDAEIFPLDLAGVTIVNAEGEGNLSAMGGFFKALGIPVFAFFDQRKRKPEERSQIDDNFTTATEIPYTGAEDLLAAETPLDRQWEFLEQLRAEDSDNRHKLPATRPDDDVLRKTTVAALKALKGEGGAARLFELCTVEELPPTITQFLKEIYAQFPRPRKVTPQPEAQAPNPEPGLGVDAGV